MKNAFLVYAMHFAIVRLINKTGAFLLPHSYVLCMALYLLMPAVIFVLVHLFALFLRKHFPKLCAVLSGNR